MKRSAPQDEPMEVVMPSPTKSITSQSSSGDGTKSTQVVSKHQETIDAMVDIINGRLECFELKKQKENQVNAKVSC